MNSEAVWTFPGPILDMLAKGLVAMLSQRGDCFWQVYGDWDATMQPTKTHKVRIKTDSGWVTIRRLEGT